ncbi:MAG TPA: carboxypeptidase regulatory-like domain-containing protein [Silvibacterium sp.]|nr:carboxypeptidase regulatory-like domain-containing protein [Silvibacterium sp.]
MRKTKLWPASLLAALLVIAAAPSLFAQETGKIHGHVQDPLGIAIVGAQVQLSSDGGQTAKFTFTTDANGDYKGDGVAVGTYTATLVTTDKKTADRFNDVKITAGADTAQDFDLSRADYIAKMTPEQKKQLEEIKAKNATINKENATIKNLNADLLQARKSNDAKNYTDADALMTKDLAAKPDEALLWVELGKAQQGEKKYDQAATSLKKAVDLDAASKKPHPDVEAAADNTLGEVLASESKIPESQAAYEDAAKLDPKGASMYYGNEAIMMDRANNVDATVAAAEKAIAADPNKPIPYYLKGKALISKATMDKAGKIVAPPGCAEAYKKYLQLAPNGQFAADAKSILAELSTTKGGKS